MKKIYNVPELEYMIFNLKSDVLSSSQPTWAPEETIKEDITPIED